jgi:hypothetical protein
MAVTRKAQKPDIRSVTFKADKNAPLVTNTASHNAEPAINLEALIQHNPLQEVRRIAFITIPLLIALGVATYLDITKHWVIPFANWLLKLGA